MRTKIKSLILTSLFILFSSCYRSLAQEKIDNFYTKIAVEKSGQIKVVETLNYDFGSVQRHGIYRDIDRIKINENGKRYVLEIFIQSVTDEVGKAYKYSTTTTKDSYQVKIGDADTLVTGKNTYNITYIVSGALTYFSEHQELYWNATGDRWEIPILNASTQVQFSESVGNTLLDVVCYTGLKGSTESNCQTSKTSNSVIVTTQNLNVGEGLTFAVKFPPDYAQILKPKKDYSEFWQTVLEILLVIAAIFYYIVLPLFLFIKWKHQKDYFDRKTKIVAAWFMAPKLDNHTSLTPTETAMLVNAGPNNKEMVATIISLAQRGYLKIIEQGKRKFLFEKTSKVDTAKLRSHELKVYKNLFSHGDLIEVSKLKDYASFATVYKNLPEEVGEKLNDFKLFVKNPNSVCTAYTGLSYVAVFTFNILLFAAVFFYGKKSAKRTDSSVQPYSEAVSLKNFLVSQDTQFDFQAQERMFFEKLLPYATAFGVEKIWLKRFKEFFDTMPDWYQGNDLASMVYLNSVVHSSYVNNTSMRSSSGFSSGFSGGSSGGGGGGGGGGSW